MRLYSPSLHKYNGKQADAEFIINHTNVTQNEQLLVCIPIISGASSAGVADSIISQVALKAPTKDTQTDIRQPSFKQSLNSGFIIIKIYLFTCNSTAICCI